MRVGIPTAFGEIPIVVSSIVPDGEMIMMREPEVFFPFAMLSIPPAPPSFIGMTRLALFISARTLGESAARNLAAAYRPEGVT